MAEHRVETEKKASCHNSLFFSAVLSKAFFLYLFNPLPHHPTLSNPGEKKILKTLEKGEASIFSIFHNLFFLLSERKSSCFEEHLY